MNTKLLSLKTLSLALLLGTAAAAQADITVYTDRTAFLAAVNLPGTDTYNDLPLGPVLSPMFRAAGPYSYQVASGPVNNFYPAGTSADVWLATIAAFDVMTFSNFSAGVRGFGGNFFGSDINGAFQAGRTIVLTATDGETTRTVNLYNTTTDTFLGFVSSNPLTSVLLRNDAIPTNIYWATANDVTLAVPEPQTYGMLLAGLGLLGFVARRSKA